MKVLYSALFYSVQFCSALHYDILFYFLLKSLQFSTILSNSILLFTSTKSFTVAGLGKTSCCFDATIFCATCWGPLSNDTPTHKEDEEGEEGREGVREGFRRR